MKNAWQTFFRVVVHMMKKGYANLNIAKPFSIATDQKSLITEVTFIFRVLSKFKTAFHAKK